MEIAGVPAHPLFVHASVVLVPLAVIGFIALLRRPSDRATYGWIVVAVAVAGALATALAAQSGEALEDALRQTAGTRLRFGEHPDQGESAEMLAFGFAAAAAALWAIDRWAARLRLPAWTPRALYGLGALVGLAATAMIVIAGHSGAALVWTTLGNFVKPQ